ncbi:BT_3987 domain-containing protein [Pedobacter segetis]|nr:DUF1735 domain-containing protein [Pedobacter segetis]
MTKNKSKAAAIMLLFATIIGITFSSCAYNDFLDNQFTYTSVYLPKPQIDRTFIVGEGMKIGVGVVLGGRLTNKENVVVEFSLDDALLSGGAFSPLPANYYQLVDAQGNPANNRIVIPAGNVQGFVYVKPDSTKFLSDPLSFSRKYALGFKLTNVIGADSILSNLKSTVISFGYTNRLVGNYFQKGSFVKTTGANSETINYSGAINDAIALSTNSPKTLIVNGEAQFRDANHKMQITIADDNTITIQSVAGSVSVTDNGGSSFDPAKHEIKLNYSFTDNGINYKASDILQFRNRVIDGVNQIY